MAWQGVSSESGTSPVVVEALGERIRFVPEFILASAWSGFFLFVVDSWQRSHATQSSFAYWGVGGLSCVTAAMLVGVPVAVLAAPLAAIRARVWGPALRIGSAVLAGVVLLSPTARWMFQGAWVSQKHWAPYGPGVVLILAGIAMAALGMAIESACRAQDRGVPRRARALIAALLLVAVASTWVDLHVFVGLYLRLHLALEAASFVVVLIAIVLGLRGVRRTLSLGRLWLWAGAWAVLSLAGSLRPAWADSLATQLPSLSREPHYVGRQLNRLRFLRLYLKDPQGWMGSKAAALAALEEEFALSDTSRDPRWDPPPSDRPPSALCVGCNVLIFYVDTLRYDVASDPRVMSEVVRFGGESLNFRRAYVTGSDTVNSLPGITGGRIDLDESHPGDLLEVTSAMGMHRWVAIPKSAREFLRKEHRRFVFDEVLEVPDYAEDKKVWGYGADQPSSEGLVDKTLQWLAEHKGERFFGWVFNFEVHAWHEMNQQYVQDSAKAAGITTEANRRGIYEAIANSVDRQFGRLRRGLQRLGLEKNTIVIFMSDHGESLGEWKSWYHSSVVWENLIRVPLMIQIPGVSPQSVPTPVSMVDVAPTLGSALGDSPSKHSYHGVDLMGVVGGDTSRPLPIMFVGQRKETLVRIGVLDPESDHKLVLVLEDGKAELYDTAAEEPDAVDLARQDPNRVGRLLNWIVRSPLYPRSELQRQREKLTRD